MQCRQQLKWDLAVPSGFDNSKAVKMQRRPLPAAEQCSTRERRGEERRGEERRGKWRKEGIWAPEPLVSVIAPPPSLPLLLLLLLLLSSPPPLFSPFTHPSLHYVLFFTFISPYLLLALNLITLRQGDECWQQQLDADDVKLHVRRFRCVLVYQCCGVREGCRDRSVCLFGSGKPVINFDFDMSVIFHL